MESTPEPIPETQSSGKTLRLSKDGCAAGLVIQDGFDSFQFSRSYFHLEKKVHLRTPSVRRLGMETMTFARQAGTAGFLVTLALWIQCAGIAVLIRWARASIERGVARLSSLHAAILMIRFSTLVIVLHFWQIFFWAPFYWWFCLPSWESSFYFSASSYSTVGYVDVVLPRVWRLLGPVEGVTGVLMCGISVSFLFVVATKFVERESGARQKRYISVLDGRSEAELEKPS
jgi:voltage-gated potassium channel